MSVLADLPPPPSGRTGWPWTEAPPTPAALADGAGWPRISIVTPSLDQGAFLEQTIRSVLLQGYPSLDYRIVDGGSSDDSVAIIERYAPWLSGWTSEGDRGQGHAINKGLRQRTGSVCAWLNADDYLLPGALFAVARACRDRPDAVAWVGACQRVLPGGELLNVVHPRGLTREALADWSGAGHFYQPACFVHTRAIDAVGPLDEDLHYAFDLDWWLRLAGSGDLVAIDEVLAAATIHPDAKTQARRMEMHAEIMAVQVRHGFTSLAGRKLEGLLAAARSGHLVNRLWQPHRQPR
jgi:glycosyltransferase involved in cell wall biosynthesis